MKISLFDRDVRIIVDAHTLHLFHHIQSTYPYEFTAFCHAHKEGNSYVIHDFFLPKQENTSTHTETDAEAINLLELEGFNTEIGGGHIHSHVNMAVNPSPTDVSEIQERAKWFFNASLIYNKKGEIYGHVADPAVGLYIQDVPVDILYPDGFYDVRLKEAKAAQDFEELRDLVSISDWEFYQMYYPLSKEIINYYQKQVAERFRTRQWGSTNKSKASSYGSIGYKTTTVTYQTDSDYSVLYDPDNLFTPEELRRLEKIRMIPIFNRTDAEQELVDRYDNYYNTLL